MSPRNSLLLRQSWFVNQIFANAATQYYHRLRSDSTVFTSLLLKLPAEIACCALISQLCNVTESCFAALNTTSENFSPKNLQTWSFVLVILVLLLQAHHVFLHLVFHNGYHSSVRLSLWLQYRQSTW